MYAVRWHDDAFRALQKLQERSNPTARAVFGIALTELPHHFPLDGGTGKPPLLWRRGITEEQRRTLAGAPRSADNGERAWNYLLVYRPLQKSEHGSDGLDGYMVLDLVRDRDVVAAYIEIIEAARPTAIPPDSAGDQPLEAPPGERPSPGAEPPQDAHDDGEDPPERDGPA